MGGSGAGARSGRAPSVVGHVYGPCMVDRVSDRARQAERQCFGVPVSTPERIVEQVEHAWGAAVNSHTERSGPPKRRYEISLEGEWRPFSAKPPDGNQAWRGLLVGMADRGAEGGARVLHPVSVPLEFSSWRRQNIEEFLQRKSLTLEQLAGKQVIVAASLMFYAAQIRATAHMVKVVADKGRYSAALTRERSGALGTPRAHAPSERRPLPQLPRRGRVTVIGPKVSDHTYEDVHGHLRQLQRRDLTLLTRRVTVAGPTAAAKISEAVVAARRDSDLVLLYRGGGTEVDFWPFQTAAVANAVSSRTAGAPVLTAIGHAADETLADRSAHRAFTVPSQMASTVRRAYAPGRASTYSDRLHQDLETERREKDRVADELERAREELLAATRHQEHAQTVEKEAVMRASRSRAVAEAHADLMDLRKHARSLRWLTVLALVSAPAILLAALVDAPVWSVSVILPIVVIAAVCERKRSRSLRECSVLRKRITDAGGRDPWGSPLPLPALLQPSPSRPNTGAPI